MQRNRRKLADVLHRCIPGQPVIQVRHHPHVNSQRPRLLHHADHQPLIPRHGKENLIHKQRPRQRKAVPHIANHVRIAGLCLSLRQRYEPLEPKSEVLQRVQMIPQRLPHPARSDNQHVARLDSSPIALISHTPPQRSAHAKQYRREPHHQQNDDPRDRLSIRHIQRAAQQQAGGQRRLHRQSLFIQSAAILYRSIQPERSRKEDQAHRKPAHVKEQHPR